MDAEHVQITVRAAAHALDAALAEHRRALALAASRRERERMARGREVKAAAAASDEALEEPVNRPMRSVRLAETWIEVDRVRHQLNGAVRASVEGGELRVWGDDWSARLALAPGDAPAAAARDAAARIEDAAARAATCARDRLERVIASGTRHAAACHAAAATLAAADRELLERHADHVRVDSSGAELAARLGPRRAGESAEVLAARDRLEHARAHLEAPPAQPYAWIEDFTPAVVGAVLRDLPADALDAALPAVARLTTELGEPEPLLALGAVPGSVVAVIRAHAIVATATAAAPYAAEHAEVVGDVLRVYGRDVATGLAENRPGRLAAVLELLRRI